jgi:tetratricopeptide (TPR) repeat protein
LKDMLLYRDLVEKLQAVAERITDKAIEEAIREKDGNVAVFFNNLGFVLQDLGQTQKAVEFYEQSLSIKLRICLPELKE